MNEYLSLQAKLLDRKIANFGIKPKIITYVLLLLSFLIGSFSVFYKIIHGEYVYVFCYAYLANFLNHPERNDFLKIHFQKGLFTKIRIIENLIISIPFLIFLLFQTQFLAALLLLVTAVLMVFSNFKKPISLAIPTPFFKKPFEFIIGFRQTFWIFPVIYFLTAIAIYADNDRLGFFALTLIFIVIGLSFYSKQEDESFICIYSLKPRDFLLKKFKTASVQSITFYLPVLISLGIGFPNSIHILLIIITAGYLLIATSIFMKYTAYPNQIDVGSFMLLVISVAFLPLLLALPFLFFAQATNKLTKYLK